MALKETRLQCKIQQVLHQKEKYQYHKKIAAKQWCYLRMLLLDRQLFVSREPGELATIYLQNELTVIGKMENAADAWIELPTVSRIHAKIRKREGEYYLTDLIHAMEHLVNGKNFTKG